MIEELEGVVPEITQPVMVTVVLLVPYYDRKLARQYSIWTA